MRKVRTWFACLLLALWLPATLHCALEAAGLDGIAACESAAETEANDEHCATDICQIIEGTFVARGSEQLTLAAPPPLQPEPCLLLDLLCLAPPLLARPLPTFAPPPDAVTSRHPWQFAERATAVAQAP